MENQKQAPRRLPIQADERVLGGTYSNTANIAHTREEFVCDFFFIMPPAAKLGARVIMAPGHAKRVLKALSDNIAKYEAKFGPIAEVPNPPEAPVVH